MPPSQLLRLLATMRCSLCSPVLLRRRARRSVSMRLFAESGKLLAGMSSRRSPRPLRASNGLANWKQDNMSKNSDLTPDQLDDDLPLEVARERYARWLTADEKKSFDEADKEAFINAEKYLASLNEEEDLLRQLVRHWVDFFRLNGVYEDYCIAQRQADRAAIEALEERYPAGEHKGIAQLYKDWGDIHADGWSFDEWLEQRRGLFFPPSKRISLADIDADKADDGRLLISVPKGIKDKQELWTMFSQFCSEHYFPDCATYEPAYSINGGISTKLVQKLDRAVLVEDLLRFNDETQEKKRDREYSHTQVVTSIMFNPLLRYQLGLGEEWKRDAALLAGAARSGTLKREAAELKSKKPSIVELEQLFTRSVERTIYGIFPA